MTVVIEDTLIAGMAVWRTLPIHDSSRRLRELYRECPRVYGAAVMGDLSRRRWWALAEILTTDQPRTQFDAGVAETGSHAAVAQQLAAPVAHVGRGPGHPLMGCEGTAGGTHPDNPAVTGARGGGEGGGVSGGIVGYTAYKSPGPPLTRLSPPEGPAARGRRRRRAGGSARSQHAAP